MPKKKNSIKKYKVLTADWSSIVEVDGNIFDDGYVEACTRAMELKIESMRGGDENLLVNPIMVCHNLTNSDEKERYINTYKVLLNASMPKRAETLRSIFMKNVSVDLAFEPLSASLKS